LIHGFVSTLLHSAPAPRIDITKEGIAMTLLMAVLLGGLGGQAAPALEVPPAETQIALAVQAAPEERRADATVLGYDSKGMIATLRKGTNDLACLADDPREKGISVACYQKDLEPFMARGRELRADGVTGKAREETRWKEIEAGTLKMPKEPRTLHVLTGSGIDAAGNIIDPYIRWVIYTPYATAESIGLPTRPVPGGPWLMFPGTPGAHVMIAPKRAGQ
jgi:hypothetical protein